MDGQTGILLFHIKMYVALFHVFCRHEKKSSVSILKILHKNNFFVQNGGLGMLTVHMHTDWQCRAIETKDKWRENGQNPSFFLSGSDTIVFK